MSIFKNERRIPRKGMSSKIKYSRLYDDEQYAAHVINSSTHGLCMISQYPYLKGTELFLKSAEPDDQTMQKANVAWSKPARHFKKSNPRYNVGVTF